MCYIKETEDVECQLSVDIQFIEPQQDVADLLANEDFSDSEDDVSVFDNIFSDPLAYYDMDSIYRNAFFELNIHIVNLYYSVRIGDSFVKICYDCKYTKEWVQPFYIMDKGVKRINPVWHPASEAAYWVSKVDHTYCNVIRNFYEATICLSNISCYFCKAYITQIHTVETCTICA